MGFITSFASTGISHGLESAGAEALTSGWGSAVLNGGMCAAFSYMQGGDPLMGAAGSLISYLANQNYAKMKAAQERIRRQQEVALHNAKMMAELYLHYQIGGKQMFNVNAWELDFSGTNIAELKLTNMRVGESRDVNLFDMKGIDPKALAFGHLRFTYLGIGRFNHQPMFSIANNPFDFDYQEKGTIPRNVATFAGGLIFGRFFNTPISITPNLFFGGPFNVHFKGAATIPAH